MPTHSYLTTCTHLSRLCPAAWEVRLRMPEGQNLDFRAGQFVLFDVPDIEDPTSIQPRAYSIASPPSQMRELTFVVMNKPGGRATRWVDQMLRVGDSVRIQGPFGAFTLDTETEKEYVFIGTGTGVAPFYSHLKYALEERMDRRPMQLIFGVRYEENLFWVDRFRALEASYPNFQVHISLTRPHDAWKGLTGRVTDILEQKIPHFSRIQAYICGSPDMVRDTKGWLIGKGMEKRDVRGEGYV